MPWMLSPRGLNILLVLCCAGSYVAFMVLGVRCLKSKTPFHPKASNATVGWVFISLSTLAAPVGFIVTAFVPCLVLLVQTILLIVRGVAVGLYTNCRRCMCHPAQTKADGKTVELANV